MAERTSRIYHFETSTTKLQDGTRLAVTTEFGMKTGVLRGVSLSAVLRRCRRDVELRVQFDSGAKEYFRDIWYAKNREEQISRTAAYRRAHPERAARLDGERYIRNREAALLQAKLRRIRNREAVLLQQKVHYLLTPRLNQIQERGRLSPERHAYSLFADSPLLYRRSLGAMIIGRFGVGHVEDVNDQVESLLRRKTARELECTFPGKFCKWKFHDFLRLEFHHGTYLFLERNRYDAMRIILFSLMPAPAGNERGWYKRLSELLVMFGLTRIEAKIIIRAHIQLALRPREAEQASGAQVHEEVAAQVPGALAQAIP